MPEVRDAADRLAAHDPLPGLPVHVQPQRVMARDFVPLSAFNAEHQRVYLTMHGVQVQRGNGIACPQCGAELYDSRPHVLLTSIPPQRDVACLGGCGYHGTRIA